MDLLRNFKHAQTFRLLALDLAGGIELEIASNGIETHWISTDFVYEYGAVL